MLPSHLFPGDKSDWLSPELVVYNKRTALSKCTFLWMYLHNVVIVVFLELSICIEYVFSAFVLYLCSVYLYLWAVCLYCFCGQCICICGQCICIVFVGSGPNQLAGPPVISSYTSLNLCPQSKS